MVHKIERPVALVRGLLTKAFPSDQFLATGIADALRSALDTHLAVTIEFGDPRENADDPVKKVEVWIIVPHGMPVAFDEEGFVRKIREQVIGWQKSADTEFSIYLAESVSHG